MFKKRTEATGEGGSFVKLESGQSIVGVFRGEVLEFFMSWPKGGDKKVSLEPFVGGKSRFKANFIVHEDGKFVAKVFEFGIRVNNMIAAIQDDCDLPKTKIRITRQGTDKNTTWTINPITKEPLTAKQLKEIDAVELSQLGESGAIPAASAAVTDEELPF